MHARQIVQALLDGIDLPGYGDEVSPEEFSGPSSIDLTASFNYDAVKRRFRSGDWTDEDELLKRMVEVELLSDTKKTLDPYDEYDSEITSKEIVHDELVVTFTFYCDSDVIPGLAKAMDMLLKRRWVSVAGVKPAGQSATWEGLRYLKRSEIRKPTSESINLPGYGDAGDNNEFSGVTKEKLESTLQSVTRDLGKFAEGLNADRKKTVQHIIKELEKSVACTVNYLSDPSESNIVGAVTAISWARTFESNLVGHKSRTDPLYKLIMELYLDHQN